MGSNPFDEWQSMVCSPLAKDHFKKNVSTAAVDVALSTSGWYKIAGDGNFYVAGPSASTFAIASTTGEHVFSSPDYRIVKASTGQHLTLLRASTTSCIVWVDRIKGE